ncbi:hypothetical protein D043_3179, partial [Vibrio parahaemolyticus EKP-021]
TCLAGQPQ